MRFFNNPGRPVRHRMLVLSLTAACGIAGGHGLAIAQSPGNGQESALVALSGGPDNAADVAPGSHAALPDAPEPVFNPGADYSSSQPEFSFDPGISGSWGVEVSPNSSERVPLNQCPYDKTKARECRVHWRPLLLSSIAFNVFQDAGNLYTGYWYRYETTHGKWFQRWIDSAAGWRWDAWDDDNPHMDQYLGHPFMGSTTDYLWIQNDPKGMTVEMGNTREYWRSRLRAMILRPRTALHGNLARSGRPA